MGRFVEIGTWLENVNHWYGVVFLFLSTLLGGWRFAATKITRLTALLPLFSLENPIGERIAVNEFIHNLQFWNSPQPQYVCKATGECENANPALAHLFKLEISQMLGYGWLAALHHEDIDRAQANWQQALDKQRPYVDEYRLADGRKVRTKTDVFRDDKGRVVRIYGRVWLLDTPTPQA